MAATSEQSATEDPLRPAVAAAVEQVFSALRRSVQKNLTVLTLGFIQLLGGCRSGHGRLSLAALSRCLPTRGTAHAREKRLHRFLANRRLDPKGVGDGLARMILGRRGRGWWPVVFDQTTAGSAQALVAGVPLAGRVLPLLAYTFEYPWTEAAVASQNQLEEIFLADVETALPAGARAVFIGDRGYCRAALLRHSTAAGRLFVIRGRAGTCVEWRGQRLKLGQLGCVPGGACSYRGVLYHHTHRVRLDVVVYHDPRFQQPWWLLVPSGSEQVLPARTAIALYRERMQVEQSFRDFKTHLGLRGLQLKVRIAERLGRVLLAFLFAYSLAVCLGASAEMKAARRDVEHSRHRPRHGTTRTLSVLSLACLGLSLLRWRGHTRRALARLLRHLARGHPVLDRPPPSLTDRSPSASPSH